MFRLNSLRVGGSPLPQQREGEGSSETTRRTGFANPSPQSSPLLQGERREKLRWTWGGSVGSPRRSNRGFQLATNLSAAGLWIAALLIAAASAAAGAKV